MQGHILYADRHLLLVRKPAGVPAQPDPSGIPDLLTELRREFPTVHLVHRLDTPTGGVMMFGLTKSAAASLSALVQDHTVFCKEYLVALPTPPSSPEGELRDFLYHDQRQNKAFVVNTERKGAKEAILSYRTMATISDGHTLLAVRLHTGRTHQIRVQFASRGLSLCGDGKYGSREKCRYIGLWAYRLSFPHPITHSPVSAASLPDLDEAPWSGFKDIIMKEIY